MRNDLRAQARAIRVMGGVVFVVGLIGLTAAIAVGLDHHAIEPFRVAMYLSTIAVILGGIVAIVANLSRRLDEHSHIEDSTVARLDRARI